ncbi:MAG TPA: hypothetical protein VFQ39_13315, partial [Longimicrobium sp.]|nr:hypothetical protein [Longimicrobium sp.]
LAAALLLAAAACTDRAEGSGAARADSPSPPPAPSAAAPSDEIPWRANPADDVRLAPDGDSVVVESGPHTIVWERGGEELSPPYTVTARLRKESGRLHEGIGILFGGTGLEGPESGQVYSYFLVRGDGTFLIKRRQGAETPVVRDWTTHAAVRRDADDGGRPNDLEVRVGETEAVFLVNGAEVARVPAADLSVRGRAGVRVSHDVRLVVSGFRVTHGAPAGAP